MTLTVLLILAGQLAFSSLRPTLPGSATTPNQASYAAPTKFERNSLDDLSAAREEAKRTKRNILIEVGGEWCEWCHIMDEFYARNPKLLELRDQYYVLMKRM
jgi:thiol:disulfide interchange protein